MESLCPNPKSKYTDLDFPAGIKSVIGNVKQSGLPEKLKELNSKCQGMKWLRAEDIDSELKLIQEGFNPNDVVQGELRNSYFLSAVSAVSEYQNRTSRIIIQQDTLKNGVFCFAFNIQGVWRMITVDDHIPLIKLNDSTFKILGANSIKKELWVTFMEKAYAKAYGGYDLIGNGGDLRHALTDLTGAPSETFILEEYLKSFKDKDPIDELWEKLKKADISRHIIGACSKSFSQIADENLELFKEWSEKNKNLMAETFSMHQFGLYPTSCYTLIGV